MLQTLISYFNNHLKLTADEIDFLHQKVPILSMKAGEYLLREGQISSAFYFVIEGVIRMHYLVDGLEKTTFFYEKNDFVSSYESFTKQVPSPHNLQTIKDSKVAVFSMEVVGEILSLFPRFEMLSRIVMEEELSTYQDMIASFVTRNAEQRYDELLQNRAHLLQLVPQHQIATYLGVSPETLSRIKKRLMHK
ncbi:MAG: Crp/Fnr family transcriptional regulator [Bacteroidota bacterium]